jgi:repressor LexA
MLTRKQKELLLLIRDHLQTDGIPPSFDEMKAALGLKSKSGIHRLITGLEERGFIRRLPHRARALEILRLPDGADTTPRPRKGLGGLADAANVWAEKITLPLLGRIAAGTPIEALAETGNDIDVPASLLASARGMRRPTDHYALEIAGDSMIKAGILDGDRVVIARTDIADNGAIVVALIDEHEATLKYFERRAEGVALIPANDQYETRLFDPSRVKIQGRLVGLIRRY